MMRAELVESTDHKTCYGLLTVENASEEEVQNKIDEIKGRFQEEGVDDYTIEDIFNLFPHDWKNA